MTSGMKIGNNFDLFTSFQKCKILYPFPSVEPAFLTQPQVLSFITAQRMFFSKQVRNTSLICLLL